MGVCNGVFGDCVRKSLCVKSSVLGGCMESWVESGGYGAFLPFVNP